MSGDTVAAAPETESYNRVTFHRSTLPAPRLKSQLMTTTNRKEK
jgi:hypothetical protein